MQIGNHIKIAVGYSWTDCLCPELSPPSDILVLRLTRGSYRIYKTVIGMCDVLSLILLRFRVTVLRAGESAGGCRGDRDSNVQ